MRDVVETVVAGEESVAIIANSEVAYTCRFGIGAVLARYMVRYEVDYDFHACIMCAVDQ